MSQSSPRNPNICVGCEQLLGDDCAELDKLMLAVATAESPARPPALEANLQSSILVGESKIED